MIATPLSFEAFSVRAIREVGVVLVEPVFGHSGLFDDLGLDSLQALQLMFAVENLAECVVPPPELPELFTLGDAYEYYLRLLGDVV